MTLTAVGVAILAAAAQYAAPAVVPLLERDPAALAGGQWWRAVTPLLVQALGWHQVLTNLVTLALFGFLAERLLDRWQWLMLFAAGTVGGQMAAYAWGEPGGGDSIAICGLAAGVLVTLVLAPAPIPKLPSDAVVYYVVALTGWGLSGIGAAAAGCVVVGILLLGLRQLAVPGVERLALAGGMACALLLVTYSDLHGISLVSGAAAMSILLTVQYANRRIRHHMPSK
jgi:hypothetical protein